MGQLSTKNRKKSEFLKQDICAYCNDRGGTRDHIEPRLLKSEHKDLWTNLTGCCSNCNQEKSVLPLLTFLWLRTLPKKERKRERAQRIQELRGLSSDVARNLSDVRTEMPLLPINLNQGPPQETPARSGGGQQMAEGNQ